MTTLRPELLDEMLADYETPEDLLGDEGLFKQLKKALLERALGAELTDHLGYEKGDPAGRGTGNSRNGHSGKTVLIESWRAIPTQYAHTAVSEFDRRRRRRPFRQASRPAPLRSASRPAWPESCQCTNMETGLAAGGTSLHEPDKFILAIVQVENGFVREPRYVCGALDTREPPFGHNAIQFNIKSLLERSGTPT